MYKKNCILGWGQENGGSIHDVELYSSATEVGCFIGFVGISLPIELVFICCWAVFGDIARAAGLGTSSFVEFGFSWQATLPESRWIQF